MHKMSEKTKKIMTLVIIHDHPRVLLGKKKRGFGVGRWNGFGGKVNEGESIEKAAVRELKEEVGIETFKIEKIGINEFEWQNGSETLEVHIFKSKDFRGEPSESDEMSPRWFFADEIPFGEMWADDQHWLPLFLAGKRFIGKFHFKDHDTIKHHRLKEV